MEAPFNNVSLINSLYHLFGLFSFSHFPKERSIPFDRPSVGKTKAGIQGSQGGYYLRNPDPIKKKKILSKISLQFYTVLALELFA